MARALGFEPRSKVLETSILPLNYARNLPLSRLKAKSYPPVGGQLPVLQRYKKIPIPFFTDHASGPFQNSLKISLQRKPSYFTISVTCPAPTVRPPSRIANFSPFSIAIGWISTTDREVLSPGITISVPVGSVTSPVTSVVRK
jgi:hypothetical protein